MANKWKNYFIKAVGASQPFPMKYIIEESWNSEPDVREEIKAERDDNTRDLYRKTASGMKSSFSFTTRDLHLEEMQEVLNYFTSNEPTPLARQQRKIQLEYWNDEEFNYKTAYFYRPNMKFNIKHTTPTDIIYKGLTLEFVEY